MAGTIEYQDRYDKLFQGATSGKLNKGEFAALGVHLGQTVDRRDQLEQNFQDNKAARWEHERLVEFDKLYEHFSTGEHSPQAPVDSNADRNRVRALEAMHGVVTRESKGMDQAHWEEHYREGHENRLNKLVQWPGTAQQTAEYYEGRLK
ncbi:MAG: hypothetical protein AB1758_19630 [Candidatus Eremiobacterota bacterium]